MADIAQKVQVMKEGWKWDKVGRRSAEKAVTNIITYVLLPKRRRLQTWSSSNMWLDAKEVSVTIGMQKALYPLPVPPSVSLQQQFACSSTMSRECTQEKILLYIVVLKKDFKGYSPAWNSAKEMNETKKRRRLQMNYVE